MTKIKTEKVEFANVDSASPSENSLRDWPRETLGKLCHLVNGDAYRESDWSTIGLPIIRIQNLNNHRKPFNHWAGPVDGRVLVKDGDVLLAWSGTPGTSFGTHLWQRGAGVLNQHIFRVDLDERRLDPTWAVFAINEQLEEMIGRAHGAVGLRHVTRREVESLPILLPPLAEQRRIAGRLREQLAEVAKARTAVQAQLTAAQALPAACLMHVFDSPTATNWKTATIRDLSTLVIDGPHITPQYVESGVPFLTIRNIVTRKINMTNVSYVSREHHTEFASRGRAERGDILYSKDGTLGIPCVVDTDAEFSFFVSVALIKLRRDLVVPQFVAAALESPKGLAQVESLGAGAGLKHMVLKSIRALEIPVPSLDEQHAIVARLAAELAEVARLRESLSGKLETLETLDRLSAALLAQAFQGDSSHEG